MCRRASRSGIAHQPRVLGEAEHEQLAARVDAGADRLLQRGHAAGRAGARASLIRRLVCGITHGGGALEDVQRATSGWIAGTNWIADAPVPIAATRSPRDVVVVVPAGGVEDRALERSSPGRSGMLGSVSDPIAGDQHARADRAVGGLRASSARRRRPTPPRSTVVPSRIER